MTNRSIAFIGTGNMSYAIISGMIKNGFDKKQIIATNRNPEKLAHIHKELSIETQADNLIALAKADVIVLSVKPQVMADLCQTFADSDIDLSNKLFISVAAGITIDRLQQMLGQKVSIIRCMPNTPSLLGKGVSGLYAQDATDDDKAFTQAIFENTGIVTWLEKESDINNIIAVTGSSPAYFFLFMEAIEKKAKALGFNDEQARQLVQQTALGAAQMVESQNIPISTLRENVTSKNGTTAAALAHFKESGLIQDVSDAMDKCINRAKEMEKEL
ncbi:pyrroline-5-carboxylate reductase [Pseudoalteromonas denitrificans]|uniref:Pyrroline-5-carboxylate reductase n=1 Tax=Pseudoalteromonas denitrificans DSM 6059 TaxID=1123010 RepID=A0A1I1E2I5_9GAMM|nr:pyrroline-5-carboxylate reductase [Pseudoalteromonas denitrificans]SFB80876.1 pyrroline-5-carboxylate reductase [Pseudoalteromonas denitrificans DSM 6059]